MQSYLDYTNPPKISEITPIMLLEYLRLSDDEIQSDRTTELLSTFCHAARSYIKGYTGLSDEEMDEIPALSIAYLILISDYYDNRNYTVDKDTVNPTVKHILNLFNRNFF